MTRSILAYLDAGTTSAIVTLILGGIAGIGVAFKSAWLRLLITLHIKKPLEDEPQAPSADAPADGARAQGTAQEPVETANR